MKQRILKSELRADELEMTLNTLLLQGRVIDEVIRVSEFSDGRAWWIIVYTESQFNQMWNYAYGEALRFNPGMDGETK